MANKRRLLHINSYFVDNHLYAKIYKELDPFYHQCVYVPIKQNRGKENGIHLDNGQIHFSKIIKKAHTVFYFRKIDRLYDDILKKGFIDDVDVVHAHNLFTDGALAYKLKKEFGLRYVVSVRTTDIQLQYKYMWHRRKFAREILAEAEHVVFISPTYKDLLFSHFDYNFLSNIAGKTSIIPNGIDEFWLDQSLTKRSIEPHAPIKLLFVGQIISRKNVLRLLNAVGLLNQKELNISLTIIGGVNVDEHKYYSKVLKEVNKLPNVNYIGRVTDRESLLAHFQAHHIFVMPSINELFGLTYIEALSQNLPVIYSRGEGIAPYLVGLPVGKEVDANNPTNIADGISTLINEYDAANGMSEYASQFNWIDITSKYRKIYRSVHE